MVQIRKATLEDINRLHEIRITVRENILSNPDLVSRQEYEEHLNQKGKGWVCIANSEIMGFAIVKVVNHSVGAMFLRPGQEGNGFGNNFSLSIEADSQAGAHQLFDALAGEGKVTMPLQETFWGDCFGMCTDKFGVQWMVSAPLPKKQEHLPFLACFLKNRPKTALLF